MWAWAEWKFVEGGADFEVWRQGGSLVCVGLASFERLGQDSLGYVVQQAHLPKTESPVPEEKAFYLKSSVPRWCGGATVTEIVSYRSC